MIMEQMSIEQIVSLLAAEYAGHCLSQMSSQSPENEKIAKLWSLYKDAKIKIFDHIQQAEPPVIARAF
jgi:hypothetical protein